MTTTLLDPEQIPLTNQAFCEWMDCVPAELEKLDKRHDQIIENYFRTGDDAHRDYQMHILKCDCRGLKIAMKATWALWKQLRDEME